MTSRGTATDDARTPDPRRPRVGWLAWLAPPLALAALLAAAPAKDDAKAFQPGKDGWLTLFDGSGLARWKPEKGADWALQDGLLAGTKGEIANYWKWVDFELRALCRGAGAIRCRMSTTTMPAQEGYWVDLADGTLRAAKGRVIAKGTGTKSADWREVRLVASRGTFTVYFDGEKVAEGRDEACPAMGAIRLVASGERVELKLLRIRPLGREEHVNVPSPNSACYVCHANFDGEPISRKHLKEDVGCAACHGTCFDHRSDEENVTAPDVMYTRGEIDRACLGCHTRHKRETKKKDGKGRPPADPVCTDCHGSHRATN